VRVRDGAGNYSAWRAVFDALIVNHLMHMGATVSVLPIVLPNGTGLT
jgi:hypothetical protein